MTNILPEAIAQKWTGNRHNIPFQYLPFPARPLFTELASIYNNRSLTECKTESLKLSSVNLPFQFQLFHFLPYTLTL